MKIIAHRCGDTRFPEGTIDAARYSLKVGADYLEMDVRFTATGGSVVAHDENLQRLFGSEKRIAEIDDETFRTLRYDGSEQHRPHFFREFLEAGLAPLLLHIKEGSARLTQLIKQINRFDYGQRVVFGVRTLDDLQLAKSENPACAVLAFMSQADEWSGFVDAGADIVRLWDSWVTAGLVEDIQGGGRQVWVMTGQPSVERVGITTADRLLELQRLGVDGVLVNDVPLAVRTLADGGARDGAPQL
jgi:glycerophosphoryl diester phosphodiesterase